MPRLVRAGEPSPRRRRAYFHVVLASDGMTPALGEAGGQPQILSDADDGWTAAGIGPLVALGFGRYYAVLAPSAVAATGTWIETRYKGAATAETPGDAIQVVGFDPTVADKAGYSLAPDGLDAIAVPDPGAPALHTTLPRMVTALWRAAYKTRTDVRDSAATRKIRYYADDNATVNATQVVVASGGNAATGEAS